MKSLILLSGGLDSCTALAVAKELKGVAISLDEIAEVVNIAEPGRNIKARSTDYDTEDLENPTDEFTQLPKELNDFLQFSYCVKCGICLAACPTSASDKLFLGPQAIAQCYHYCADSRDEGEQERFPIVDADHGVWHCHLAVACSEACPKGVDPALAIQLLKRRLTSQALGLRKKQPPAPVVSPPTETKPRSPFPDFTVKGD